MRSFSLLAVAAALAGQALALNIVFGGTVGNITTGQLLDFGSHNDFVDQANCTSTCSNAMSTIKTCGTDDHCLCTNGTAQVMLSCEQCLFTYVVDKNISPVPDPRIGSQPGLAAFIAACAAPPLNTTIMPLKLAVPPSWMGPESNKLGLGATIVAVGAGAILGGGSLFLLTHLE